MGFLVGVRLGAGAFPIGVCRLSNIKEHINFPKIWGKKIKFTSFYHELRFFF